VRVVVDTGIFSASLSRRRRLQFDAHVQRMVGNQILLAAVTVSELRYGALAAEWGPLRRQRLEDAIAVTTVIPLTDTLLTGGAELRFACRRAGHPLADRAHANDLWIAASAIHIGAPLLTADRVFADTPGLALLSEPVDP
jgi:predicted nucleic acid-binding protein